jgi:hypothetical protein
VGFATRKTPAPRFIEMMYVMFGLYPFRPARQLAD